MGLLPGQTAFISGAGAGIGRATAICFAREGANVAVTDINLTRARSVAEEIRISGGSAREYALDVMDQQQALNCVDMARDAFGKIDILMNNAVGAIVAGPGQSFDTCSREFIDRMLGVNLMGAIYLTQAVIKEMKARRSGRIINMSSVRGVAGDKGILYGTAKGALIAFTKSLAMNLGEYGVTVNALAPGSINSRPEPGAQPNFLGRPGTCEEVAELALFLASKHGAFITGQTIGIDGGRTLGCRSD